MASYESTENSGAHESPNFAQPSLRGSRRTRQFSRSPHPYRRHGPAVLTSDVTSTDNGDTEDNKPPSWRHSSKTSSESGTEADDESTGLLKGLPAPPARPRKGLRITDQNNETGPAVPYVYPLFRELKTHGHKKSLEDGGASDRAKRRRLDIFRRISESILLLTVGAVVYVGNEISSHASGWRIGK